MDLQFVLTYTDSIYVGAYEKRMDLMRAAIGGASGTPYQDGQFFFDIRLIIENK